MLLAHHLLRFEEPTFSPSPVHQRKKEAPAGSAGSLGSKAHNGSSRIGKKYLCSRQTSSRHKLDTACHERSPLGSQPKVCLANPRAPDRPSPPNQGPMGAYFRQLGSCDRPSLGSCSKRRFWKGGRNVKLFTVGGTDAGSVSYGSFFSRHLNETPPFITSRAPSILRAARISWRTWDNRQLEREADVLVIDPARGGSPRWFQANALASFPSAMQTGGGCK